MGGLWKAAKISCRLHVQSIAADPLDAALEAQHALTTAADPLDAAFEAQYVQTTEANVTSRLVPALCICLFDCGASFSDRIF